MKPTSLSWLILIALSLIWGSSFILMKEGLKAFSSDEVAALRISIAFLVLAPFLVKQFSKVNFRQNWKGLILMGVFGNLLPAFLFTKAETQISSSLTGMLNSLTPLFTILTGMLAFNIPVSRQQLIGVLTGLAGAVLLLGLGGPAEQSQNLLFSFLVVAATFCYAISVNGIRRHLSGVNSFTATVGAFTIIGPMALAYLLVNTSAKEHLLNHPQGSAALGFICILAILGTAISVVMFNVLIKQAGAV
ncbi:MAG: DMT family transporter, partial [Bacteroidia bacterium]